MKRLLIPLALLLVFVAPAFAYYCWDGTQGAEIWYSMDSTADSCTFWTPDVLHNNSAQDSFAGKWNTAYNFTGAVSMYNTSAGFHQAGNYTFNVWVRMPVILSTTRVVAMRNSATTTDYYNYAILGQTNQSFACSYGNGAGANYQVFTSGGAAVPVNTWTMITCRYTDNGGARNWSVWVNGVLNASYAPAASPVHAASGAFCIGSYANATMCVASNQWVGAVDEVSIWNYSATAAQIADIYTLNTLGSLAVSFSPVAAVNNTATTYTATQIGNTSSATGWWWMFNKSGATNFTGTGMTTSQTLNVTGLWNVTLIGEFGVVNYTNSSGLVSVVLRPTANYTVSSTAPYFVNTAVAFLDASNCSGLGSPCSYWWWNFNDSTALNTSQNASHTWTVPGVYNVSLMVADKFGINASTAYSTNVSINGFMLNVYNELALPAYTNVTCWTAVVSNATFSTTLTCQNNTYAYNALNSSFPTGSLTIALTATGYVGRTYYAYYDVGYSVDLDAYLLDTSSGIYPIFTVVDSALSPLQSALVAAYRQVPGSASILVSQKYTDAAGGAQMYLDPAITYTILATRTGYDPYSGDITPVAREYIIILTASNATNYTWFSSNDTFFITIQPYSPVFRERLVHRHFC